LSSCQKKKERRVEGTSATGPHKDKKWRLYGPRKATDGPNISVKGPIRSLMGEASPMGYFSAVGNKESGLEGLGGTGKRQMGAFKMKNSDHR